MNTPPGTISHCQGGCKAGWFKVGTINQNNQSPRGWENWRKLMLLWNAMQMVPMVPSTREIPSTGVSVAVWSWPWSRRTQVADCPNLATPIAAEAVVLKKLQVKWCQKSETVHRSILIHFGRSWRWESDLCGKRVSAWKRELLPALLVV